MSVRRGLGVLCARLAMQLVRLGVWIAGAEPIEPPSKEDVAGFEAWRRAHRRDA
jgi:hypothetical protein